jgi:hypothetical protein
MDSTVKIYFRGLAACQFNGEGWEVGFVCDETHKLNLYDRRGLNGVSLSGATGINIRAEGAVVPRKPCATADEGAFDFKKVFNLTGNYAHANGAVPKNPDSPDQNGMHNVRMTIDNAFFFSAEQTDKKYKTVESIDGRPTGRKHNVGYVIDEVGAMIVFPKSGSIKIEAAGAESFVKSYLLKPGDLLTLVFDNNCETGKCHRNSDFYMYYNMFEDKENKMRKFEVEIDGNVAPFDKDGEIKTPGRVNCYPVRVGDEMFSE